MWFCAKTYFSSYPTYYMLIKHPRRTIILTSLLLALSLIIYSCRLMLIAPGPLLEQKILIFSKGTTVAKIVEKLSAEKIIIRPRLMKFAIKICKIFYPLKAGEYSFTTGISASQIIKMMIQGKSLVHKLILPEGLTSKQIIDKINSEDALLGNKITSFKEGYLLPDTYFFSYGDHKEKLINIMHQKMNIILDQAWEKRDPTLPITNKEDALILASIIEKETGSTSERSRIAGIFINRLKKNMPLQADPTVIYSVTLGQYDFTRAISKADLKMNSEYNTYLKTGLPPTPICNPGKAAIEATMHPSKSNELFFVVDINGGHKFATNLNDHNQNVNDYRKNLPTPAK